MSRTEKKSFFDLYAEQKKKPTPAQNFIAEIAALTHRSENTVKMWLCGRQDNAEYHSPSLQPEYKRPLPKIGGAIQ